jgi:hypothetical protein
MAHRSPVRRRVGLVLSAGGARGAYEAGVLAHLFEEIYPRLSPGFEFDVRLRLFPSQGSEPGQPAAVSSDRPRTYR